MQDLFLYLFIAACSGLILWGMGRPERVYQYPFLIGAIFSAFLIPQALSLVHNPGMVSEGAIDRTLLMGALCMLMAWAGYAAKPLRSVSEGRIRTLNKGKLNSAALAISAISLAALYVILRMPPEGNRSNRTIHNLIVFFEFLHRRFPCFPGAVTRKNHMEKRVLISFQARLFIFRHSLRDGEAQSLRSP